MYAIYLQQSYLLSQVIGTYDSITGHMSHVKKKQSTGLLCLTNWSVQSEKRAKSLKFHILKDFENASLYIGFYFA